MINDGDSFASISTAQKHMMAKFLKLAQERPDEVHITKQTEDYMEMTCPKSYVKVRPPRQMSDEQKEKARERLRAYQVEQKKKKNAE